MIAEKLLGAFRRQSRQPLKEVPRTPTVCLCNFQAHPVFASYASAPPVGYASHQNSEVCHWMNVAVDRTQLNDGKAHLIEMEHLLALAPSNVKRPMKDYATVYAEREQIESVLRSDACKGAFTFSAGLAQHSKRFLSPDLWSKVSHVYPSFPAQEAMRPAPSTFFTILVIASRYSDKGVPEAIAAYSVLRERFGSSVKMTLVCQDVPTGVILPEGIDLHANFTELNPFMTDEYKAKLYRSADVLVVPSYGESAFAFVEAAAFGVPVITTRIHHGNEFVLDGQTGFLIDPPLFVYSEGFGTRWKTAESFVSEVESLREAGKFKTVVDQLVDRLQAMFTGAVNTFLMRQRSVAFHAERFHPEVRNQRLLKLYRDAVEPSPIPGYALVAA